MIDLVFYILFWIMGFMAGMYIIAKKASIKLQTLRDLQNKDRNILKFLNEWLLAEGSGKKIELFLKTRNCKSIAIYGMGRIGQILLSILKDKDINVAYVIDKRELNMEVPQYRPTEMLPNVDIIIITAIEEGESIRSELKKRVTCPIYLITEII